MKHKPRKNTNVQCSGTKETLNQPGEQGNAITSHQMQSGKQLDDMHKENGKSGTVTEGKDTLQSSKHQSTQNSKTIRTQNDNQVKQDSERQGSKQSHQNNVTNNTERQNDQVQNTHHAERNGSQSTTSQSNDVDKSQPSIPAQKVLPNHDKAAPTSTTPRLMIKLHLNQQKHKMQPRTNIQINKIHINPRIKS